jgi:hypothetical protein
MTLTGIKIKHIGSGKILFKGDLRSIIEEQRAHHRVTLGRPVRADKVPNLEAAGNQPLAFTLAYLH